MTLDETGIWTSAASSVWEARQAVSMTETSACNPKPKILLPLKSLIQIFSMEAECNKMIAHLFLFLNSFRLIPATGHPGQRADCHRQNVRQDRWAQNLTVQQFQHLYNNINNVRQELIPPG